MNVRGRDLGSFVAEAQARVAKAVPMPTGYDMTWGGEFENQQRAMTRLRLVLPIALLLTFLLLFSTFGTLFDSLTIIGSLPLALLGGVVGLAIAHMPLSVSAAVGFIALLGQADLNGVLVVSAIRARLAAAESIELGVVNGTRERLRAVLMTALLASLGLLPAALSHAIGSSAEAFPSFGSCRPRRPARERSWRGTTTRTGASATEARWQSRTTPICSRCSARPMAATA